MASQYPRFMSQKDRAGGAWSIGEMKISFPRGGKMQSEECEWPKEDRKGLLEAKSELKVQADG